MSEKQDVTPFDVIVKTFNSEKGALTLKPSEVCDGIIETGHFTRKHDDDWVIEGFIEGDSEKFWVNGFMAEHPKFLRVYGDFEFEVFSDSEDGLADFMKNHSPEDWDYGIEEEIS